MITSARVLFASAVILLLQACGQDPHDFRITEKNKDTFMEEIKDMKGLTVNEVRLLISYEGGNGSGLVGKTVGQAVEEARREAAELKTVADQQERIAAEAKVKEEAIASALRKSLPLTVVEKGFLPSSADILSGRYRDYITIRCTYRNASAKDIRAFKGTLEFQDLSGVEMFRSGLTVSNPVAAGATGVWDDKIEFNQFNEAQQRFRNADLKQLKVVWMPSSIFYADGSRAGQTIE